MHRRVEKPSDDLPDARDTDWNYFLRGLDELILDNNYRWARTTLAGIRETVERTGTVSPRQHQAVKNIINGLWPIRRRLPF